MSKRKTGKTNPETYIDKLKFDPKLLVSLPGKYFTNVRLMALILISIVFLGITSVATLPKTLNPEVEIPFFVISTVMPGATPTDVESLITVPIESDIKKIKGIDTYNSVSQDNVSIISVEFTPDTDPAEARNDLQVAVDGAKVDLPEDANDPILQQLDFEDQPVWQFALREVQIDEESVSLARLSRQMEEELEDLSDVSRVEVSGLDERQIHIIIRPEVIREKKVNIFDVMDAIKKSVSSYPAGVVTTEIGNYSVVIDQPATTILQLRTVPVEVDEQTFQLYEIAEVVEQSRPNQNKSLFLRPDEPIQPVVVFSVYKTSDARIDSTKDSAQALVDNMLERYGGNYESISINDFAKEIDDQIGGLMENFYQTLALVFGSMFLLYGVRQSVIAAVAIPFTLFIIFVAMQLMDFTVNFLSIYSLLIGLGLFTDNAVVIIQGFTDIYRSKKFRPLEAALLTWKDYSTQLVSINLLTVWAFLPLLTMTGLVGEFIKPLPIIVSVAMMASVFIALAFTLPSMRLLAKWEMPSRVLKMFRVIISGMFVISVLSLIPKSFLFLPTLMFIGLSVWLLLNIRKNLFRKLKTKIKKSDTALMLARYGKRAIDEGFISLDKLIARYREIITRVLERPRRRKRVLLIIGIFTIFSYLLFPLGFVKNEFFPKSDFDRVLINLELPLGTNREISEKNARELMPRMLEHESVEFVTAEVGQSVSTGFSFTQPEANNIRFTLFLIDEDERESSIDVSSDLRMVLADIKVGKLSVVDFTGGPPAGADLDISIAGDSLDTLQKLAGDVEEFLKNLEGATNIERNVKGGKSKLVFVPEKEALIKEGLNESTIGFWLRTYINGVDVKTVNFQNQDLDVVIRVNESLISPEDLSTIEISKEGKFIPLNSLGKVVLEPSTNQITRKDGKRTITVTGSAEPGYVPPQLNAQLTKFANEKLDLPDGYSWQVGGANQENEEANQSILRAMVISAILILATMVVQLGSFRKAVIVMMVIPLAISGVFVAFALTATPLSFPAMMGLLSLFGIVIANSLMIVEKVTKNLNIGFSFEEAIPEAATSRIEPILLTSAAQVIGLIPATLADPIWRGFGGAIIAGLSFSGTIMLFFIPIVYFYFFPELRKN